MTAPVKPHNRIGLAVVLTALVVAILCLLAPHASASQLQNPQTRIAVIDHPAAHHVGPSETVLPGGSRPRAPNYGRSATGSDVAAETEVPQIIANQTAGNAARDAIAARYPGAEIEQTFQTALGARRVDVLTQDGLAIESKVGYTSLTKSIQLQIAKDQLLMQNPAISGVEWELGPSAVTGQVGPSGLAAALDTAGIPWSIGP